MDLMQKKIAKLERFPGIIRILAKINRGSRPQIVGSYANRKFRIPDHHSAVIPIY